jgi:hypothetical protein
MRRVRTGSYIYAVHDCSRRNNPREVFSYQWHPDSKVVTPQVHFKQGEGAVGRAHLPTGRIPIESVVECLIKDFEVDFIKSDGEAILARNRAPPERLGEPM